MDDITSLITACLSGDKAAWNALFKEYASIAMQLLKTQFPTLAPLDRDDIVQMVFSRLAQFGLRNFHGSSRNTFLAYFGVIVKNEARSFLAAEKMRRNVILPERDTNENGEDLPPYEIPDHRWRPDEALERRELLLLIQTVLNDVPFVTRQVFLMKNKGATDQEIAAVLKIPMGTVAQKYSRVKEKLRRLLNENISGRKTRFGQS